MRINEPSLNSLQRALPLNLSIKTALVKIINPILSNIDNEELTQHACRFNHHRPPFRFKADNGTVVCHNQSKPG